VLGLLSADAPLAGGVALNLELAQAAISGLAERSSSAISGAGRAAHRR
jgi:hypothetical protein